MRLRPAAVVTALITSLGLALTPSAAPAAPTVPAEAGETVISVTSFGADPTGVEDSAVAVKAAVAAAKDADGPVRIVFPRGVYQLYPDHAERRELYFSNTIGTNLAYKDKTIAVLLEDMTDVTVDGQGSVFMMHGQQSVFGIRRSANTTVQDFAIDWVTPRVVDLTVVGVGEGYRDLRIPDGYRYTIDGTTLGVTSELSPYTGQPYWQSMGYQNLRSLPMQQYDLGSARTWREGNGAPLFDGVASITEQAPNVLRFTYSGGTPGPLGRVYSFRNWDRDNVSAFTLESTNTTIQDLEVRHQHGFGFLSQMSDTLTVRNNRFRTKSDSWRRAASFADQIHVSGDKGSVLIEGNDFGFAQDDPINVHGTYVQLVAKEGNQATFRYMHHETAGFPQFYVGNEVALVEKATMTDIEGWRGTVTAVTGPTGHDDSNGLTDMTVTFDKPLPAAAVVNATVGENLTYSPSLTVRGNHFETIPTRGVLATTRRPVVIEHNVFDQMEMAQVFISADSRDWYESSVVRDFTIRDNVFIRHGSQWQPTAAVRSLPPVLLIDPLVGGSDPTRTAHDSITIDGNTFLVGDVTILDAKTVNNISFTNNTVARYDSAARPELALGTSTIGVGQGTAALVTDRAPYAKPLFVFRGSNNVTVAGNTYDDGFNRVAVLNNMAGAVVDIDDAAIQVGGTNNGAQAASALGYTSSDPAVATVDANGLVVGVAPGSAEISRWTKTPAGIAVSQAAPITVVADPVTPPDAGPWTLNPAISVIRPEGERSSILADGRLQLFPAGASLWQGDGVANNLHALTTPTLRQGQSVTVKLSGRTQTWYEEAGLLLYTDDDNYVAIQRKHGNGNRSLAVVTEQGASADESRRIADPAQDDLWLRLTRTGATTVQGAYSTDGATFTALGSAVTNASITDASRVVLAAGGRRGADAQLTPFAFGGLTVGDTAVPLATRNSSIVDDAQPGPPSAARPEGSTRLAELSGATFTGVTMPAVDLTAPNAQVVTRIPDTVTEYTAQFTTVEPGATVRARLDGEFIEPDAPGRFTVPVTGGPTVLDVWVTAPDGVAQLVYRWATMSTRAYQPDFTPEPPSIEPIPDSTVQAGTQVSIQVQAAGPGPLAYTATGLPEGLTIDATTGLISGRTQEGGEHEVSILVRDAEGVPGRSSFTLTVEGTPKISVASAPSELTLSSDGTVTFSLADVPDDSILSVAVPNGWQVSPSRQWADEGDTTASVTVRAPQTGTSGTLTATITSPDGHHSSASAVIALRDPAVVGVAGIVAWDSAEPAEGAPNGLVTAAIDGDPATFWHTQWSGGSPKHPHYIVLDLGSVQTLSAFTYVPRAVCGTPNNPPGCNGTITGYRIEVATSGGFTAPTSQQLQGTTYPEPAAVAYTTAATGTWPNSTAAKTVTFDAPIEARYVKLTSTSAVGGQAWASAAELLPGGEPAGVPGELADVALVPRSTASPSPSVSPTPSKSPSAKPSLTPSVKPSATPTTGTGKFVRTAPYTKPGTHLLNGRQWMTVCEDYSQTERCRTEIWATIVVIEDGSFMRKSGWAFNNLTYLPYMTREAWNGNPLGDLGSTTNGVFTSAGRQWKTECDTAATGRGACRSYTWTTVYAATAKPEGGYAFSQSNQWIFNNIVMFEN